MKNVLFCHEDLMLIDMETLCTGQPLFDLQGLYVTYKAFADYAKSLPMPKAWHREALFL
ncbi:hypothetical protein [Selenomonas sp. AB3002]|uniref:hypothetical protein n=1 Tax=Selenomonas sp. AB3002 TaxID=1392502 RepID=UPI000A8391AC